MLKWIKSKFEDFLIQVDLKKFENEKLKSWKSEADKKFDWSDFDKQLDILNLRITRETEEKFDFQLSTLREQKILMGNNILKLKKKIEILDRPYQAEIDILNIKLSQIEMKLRALYLEKNDQHKIRADAQSSINHWYRMADCFLGNRGQKIPKSRIFGRDQNDLEFFKTKKSTAIKRINQCKSHIIELKREKLEINEKIASVSFDQKEFFALSAQMITKEKLNKHIEHAKMEITKISAKIISIEKCKSNFVVDKKIELNFEKIEYEIQNLKTLHHEFLQEFNSEISKNSRQKEHRAEWLKRQKR